MLDEDRVEVGDGRGLLIVERAHSPTPIGTIVFRLPSASALIGERVRYFRPIGGDGSVRLQTRQRVGRGRCGVCRYAVEQIANIIDRIPGVAVAVGNAAR
jgi:hypothetical protein